MTEQAETKEKDPFSYSEAEKQALPMPNETSPDDISSRTKLSVALQKAKHRFTSKGKNKTARP